MWPDENAVEIGGVFLDRNEFFFVQGIKMRAKFLLRKTEMFCCEIDAKEQRAMVLFKVLCKEIGFDVFSHGSSEVFDSWHYSLFYERKRIKNR